MVNAFKTGSPQEIAETLREMAKTYESLPSYIKISIEVKTEVHKEVKASDLADYLNQTVGR